LLANRGLLKFIKTTIMPIFNRVRDKIGMTEIPIDAEFLSDQDMREVVSNWIELFRMNRILLSFNEEEIDYKRRYVFIRNVFLDMQLPAHPPEMYFCFLYDYYRQDIFPSEPESLVGELLDSILGGDRQMNMGIIHKRIKLNHFHNLSEPEFIYVLDCHQRKYDSISGNSLMHEEKILAGNRLVLKGSHTTGFCQRDHCTIRRGNWKVELLRNEGIWLVSGIFIEGIEF
jgi:hypothetical protein